MGCGCAPAYGPGRLGLRIKTYWLFLLLFLALPLHAQDADTGEVSADTEANADDAAADAEEESNGDGIESPRSTSGMSIPGNEEAPKALVIIPWKSSELGDDISLSDSLEERAQPVDREVFLRELNFYRIRSGD